MSRESFVFRNGELIPKHLAGPHPRAASREFQVMPDIAEFRSPVDGSVISSRSHLRHHNRAHGVAQIGNDRLERRFTPAPPVEPDILRAIAERGIR